MEQTFYVVYSGSEKLGLADKAKPVAFSCFESHAEELRKKYGSYGSIKQVSKERLLEIIREEF